MESKYPRLIPKNAGSYFGDTQWRRDYLIHMYFLSCHYILFLSSLWSDLGSICIFFDLDYLWTPL